MSSVCRSRLAVDLRVVRAGVPLTWHMNAAEPHPPAKGLDSSFIEIGTLHVLDLRDNRIAGRLIRSTLLPRSGTYRAAIARSFAVELIERGGAKWDLFWAD
jgi:hypothetical protein